MKIGFSLSRCVHDLVHGIVDYDDVVVVISRTKMETLDHIHRGMTQYTEQGVFGTGYQSDPTDMAIALFEDGRLFQPRLYGKMPAVPGNDLVWMDLFPTVTGAGSEQIEKAWKNYRMLLKLATPGTLPSDEDARRVKSQY